MKKEVIIQNLKCGGCATTIGNALNSIQGISETHVNLDENRVEFETESDISFDEAIRKLDSLGYPVNDDVNSLYKKVKSYVSCAVGRMTDDKASEK
jgi:copper chaperone